jgi:phosphohistidine phosphatase SixA
MGSFVMDKIFLALLGLFYTLDAVAVDSYSIYLVRHAEKQKEGENPKLTDCGKRRAKELANLLSQANIRQVYSTSYQRTRQTASPLAKANKLAIQNYNPRYLAQLAIQLQKRKENTLVVGHSNTTPQLAELLIKQEMPPLRENDYQQLYQIHFIGKQNIITKLTQPLICIQ